MRAVIIDDSAHAVQTLAEDLANHCPEIRLIGTAEGVISGAKLIKKEQPDIVFLDIQMDDGTGFDLLEILDDYSFQLIFTTASDAYAIKAFRFSAIDYLLKPIDPDELVQAVEKAGVSMEDQHKRLELLKESITDDKPFKRLALHSQEKILIVELEDVVRCESSGNYTIFHLSDDTQVLVTKTLKEFDQLLQSHSFYRVHQSHLIHTTYIKEFVKADGGYLVMKNGVQIPVSSRKKSAVLQLLNEL